YSDRGCEGARLPGRHGLQHLQVALETHTAWIEVALEEELGQSRLRVPPDVLTDLRSGAPERAPVLALWARVKLEAAARDDLQSGPIAAPLRPARPDLRHHRPHPP